MSAPTLADVLAVGVEPTEADTAQARATLARAADVTAVLIQEAAGASACGFGLAEALAAGDVDRVARLVRQLCATSAAADERMDAVLAAPGGAR